MHLSRTAHCLVWLGLIWSCLQASTHAQDDQLISEVKIGFNQQAKLGKWLPVTITTDGSQTPTRYSVAAVDGSATIAHYQGELAACGENQYQAWARIGKTYGNVVVTLFDGDKRLGERTFELGAVTDLEASTSNFTLLIGNDEQLLADAKKTAALLFEDAPHQVVEVANVAELPFNSIGYDAINVACISTGDSEELQSLQPDQWKAIQSWVERGGRLIVFADGQKNELGTDGFLSRFLVGQYSGTATIDSMARLDEYTDTRLDAAELQIAELTSVNGKVELSQNAKPLVVRQPRGLGQIAFVTFDISNPALTGWEGRENLLLQLIKPERLEETQDFDQGSRVTHPGYTDLIGQLRIPLEQFSRVQMINFTVVAVLIGLYLLCVGPGDFFLLKKVVKKMEMTWVTFSLLTVLFCAAAWSLASWSRPSEFQINQLEIIDVDQESGIARGTLWSNLYSPRTSIHDLALDSSNSMGVDVDTVWTSWQGIPGDGLGGMLNRGLSPFQGDYEVKLDGPNQSTSIKSLPLQVSSTKSFHSEWFGKLESPIDSSLYESRGRLLGTITNPFDFELKSVRVMYGKSTYLLNSSLSANETVDLGAEAKERTSQTYLNGRRKTTDEKDRGQNQPWNPTGDRMDRIADMLMFYRLAGGKSYTTLTHDFQNRIEMSDQTFLDRAVLVAEVESQTMHMSIDGKNLDNEYDNAMTVIRFVLPVDTNSKSR